MSRLRYHYAKVLNESAEIRRPFYYFNTKIERITAEVLLSQIPIFSVLRSVCRKSIRVSLHQLVDVHLHDRFEIITNGIGRFSNIPAYITELFRKCSRLIV